MGPGVCEIKVVIEVVTVIMVVIEVVIDIEETRRVDEEAMKRTTQRHRTRCQCVVESKS